MKPSEQTCDRERIEDYLAERLGSSEAAELEQHLTDCQDCRDEMQARSAAPEIWRETIALLTERDDNEDTYRRAIADQQKGDRIKHVLSVVDSLTPTDDPEMLGRVGEYEISGVVGVGGMGTVLKGFDKSLRRVVAIKVMAPHLANSGSARTRFQREARAAAAITHDNVIDTYSVAEANGLPYLVMPFARGPSLQKRIDESGPLTTIEIVRIARQIASGLAAAHEQGLVHRDIKPANILLNEGVERLWISDFGVARAMDDASMTQTGVIAGTPQYMSPEQARGESVDPRSDLFSMGSVLYTACTGRAPFRSEAAYGILRRITDTQPRPIRQINPEIPVWLCGIIDRLMEKNPDDRFQNAWEVAKLFDDCLVHLQQPDSVELPPSLTTPVPSRPSRSGGPPRTRIPRRFVGLACGMLFFALAGFAIMQATEPADIAGRWQGERWKSVSLSTVDEATDWYNGSLTDADDRRGALQLEWSRLQRRYNGRWKIGDELSGNLTLRVSGNELRGAVSVDPESRVAADQPRLHEFTWQRADGDAEATGHSSTSEWKRLPIAIQSPSKGQLVRLGEGIQENARVKAGDLIAVIDNQDQELLSRQEAQLRQAKAQQDAMQTILEAKQRERGIMAKKVDTMKSQYSHHQKAELQSIEAANQAVMSRTNQVELAKAELQKATAAMEQAEQDFQRQKRLYEKEIVSQEKFEEAQQKSMEAQSKFNSERAQVRAAESALATATHTKEVIIAENQAKLQSSQVELMNTQLEEARIESELAKAKADFAIARQAAEDLQRQIARSKSTEIRSPVDGQITQLNVRVGAIAEGDPIGVIRSSPKEETSPNDRN